MNLLKKVSAVFGIGALVLLVFLMRGSDDDNAPTVEKLQTAKLNGTAAAHTGGTIHQDIMDSRRNAVTRAVERVSPAVVGIGVKGVRKYRVRMTDDPYFRLFFPDRIFEREINGLGSGFIISPDGYIITNQHVVEDATEITVTLTTRDRYQAEVVNEDYAADIALLKIDGENFPYLELGDSDDVIIGEWVVAFGNPFGLFEINDQPSVTVGVVSATGRDFGKNINDRYYNGMIQTDASINPGNSGGPLVNSLGQVIGVNAFILTGGSTERGSVGIGFAIPINKVTEVIEELKATAGEPREYFTGIKVYPINRFIQFQLGLSSRDGALIVSVEPNSPGERAGLRSGDVIIEVNGSRVQNPEDVIEYIERINPRPGKTLNLVAIRGNYRYETTLTLGEMPKEQ